MAFTTKRGIKVYERRDWGARPAKAAPIDTRPIMFAGIHHGGVVGGPRLTFSAAAATCRDWQHFHMDVRGWNDLAYNLLVDGLGRVYEGRMVGTLAAGVLNHNSNGVHVNFMQDGDRFGLTPLAKRTLRILFEHGIPELHLVPLKRFANDPRDEAGVFGHREFSGHETNACPGQKILSHLRWRRVQYKPIPHRTLEALNGVRAGLEDGTEGIARTDALVAELTRA
jgi:hypothetical protein